MLIEGGPLLDIEGFFGVREIPDMKPKEIMDLLKEEYDNCLLPVLSDTHYGRSVHWIMSGTKTGSEFNLKDTKGMTIFAWRVKE